MAGKIIVSTLQSDTDNSISFVANTGTTIFSANISHGIAGSFIANGSITGDKIGATAINANNIVDGAVTVSKGGTGLSTLTANSILIGNGTSSPQFIAPGTSANVLTSNGTNWISSAPAGSPLTLIETSNVTSAVTAVTFSNLNSNTYISYMLSFEGLISSAGSTNVQLNLGNNTTIISSDPSEYTGTMIVSRSGSSSLAFTNSTLDSIIRLTDGNTRADDLGGVNGIAWISNLKNGTVPAVRSQVNFFNSNLGEAFNCISNFNLVRTNECITQVRIKFLSGNINKGRVTIYGLKAS